MKSIHKKNLSIRNPHPRPPLSPAAQTLWYKNPNKTIYMHSGAETLADKNALTIITASISKQ